MSHDFLFGGCSPLCSSHCDHAVVERPDTGRFYIAFGHPGFNSPANNRDGYKTREAALAATRRYGSR